MKSHTSDDGFVYEFSHLEPEQAFDVFCDLQGAALGQGFDKNKTKAAMRVFAGATVLTDPNGKKLGVMTPALFTEHFTGRFKQQMAWFNAAVEEFFGGLGNS